MNDLSFPVSRRPKITLYIDLKIEIDKQNYVDAGCTKSLIACSFQSCLSK